MYDQKSHTERKCQFFLNVIYGRTRLIWTNESGINVKLKVSDLSF